ncbi:DUF6069 family protein [Tessaracoccus sp. G1721]
MSATSTATRPATPETVLRPRRALLFALGALALNLAAFGLGSLAGASYSVGQPYPISAWAVLAATLVAFTLGALIVWLVSRWRPSVVRVVAWGGLVLGLVSSLSLVAAADVPTAVALATMHVATSAAWFLAVKPAQH